MREMGLLLLTASLGWAGPVPGDARRTDTDRPGTGEAIEVQFIDDSRMKMTLLDDKIELITKHGVLKIAVADVRRIEFATRTPPEITQKIAAAVVRLGHDDSQVRDRAMSELKMIRERAYPALLDASKGADAEVVRRAELLIRGIKAAVPAANLAVRELDVVVTDDSRIAGRIATPILRVQTLAFGDQSIKLSDLRAVGPSPIVRIAEHAAVAPATLMAFQGQFGKEMTFSVTGGIAGTVWGSDQYTLDSAFATAAVHAGKVQVGQTTNVTIRIIMPPGAFGSSTRNGVATSTYNAFPAGAFEFVE